MIFQNFLDQRRIRDVAFNKKCSFADKLARASRQVVNDNYGLTTINEGVNRVAANIARASRYQYAHFSPTAAEPIFGRTILNFNFFWEQNKSREWFPRFPGISLKDQVLARNRDRTGQHFRASRTQAYGWIMISDRFQCIFVHIPKTGGTSVENLIWPLPWSRRTREMLWMHIDSNNYQTGGLQHLRAVHIREEVGAEKFARYFRFSFVRNPWDRAVSQFSYLRQRRPDLQQLLGLEGASDFNEYLSRISEVDHVQWAPQLPFLCDDDGSNLVDFIGRYERLEADAQDIFDRLGIAATSIPHEMKSEHGPYRDYYDHDSRFSIARLYRADIEAFGYSF